MKTTINLSLVILTAALIIFSCKKKDDSTPPPASTTTTGTTTGGSPSGQTFSAVVNGTNFAVGMSSINTPLFYKYNNFPERGLGAQDNNNTPYQVVTLYFMPAVGTFTLSQSGLYKARYSRSGDSYFFSSKSGTINITSYDTSGVKSPYLDKLKCTFSFITDSMAGQSHTITNGYVDFVHP